MNKGITVLILFAVLGAMGLIFYSHTSQPNSGVLPAVRDAPASVVATGVDAPAGSTLPTGPAPLKAPQDGNGGLKQIEPPLTSGVSNAPGAPAPVTLTAGDNARQIPPVDSSPQAVPRNGISTLPPLPGKSRPDAAVRPLSPEPPVRASNSSPSITPWGTPPGQQSASPETASAPAAAGRDKKPTSSLPATAAKSNQGNGQKSRPDSAKEVELSPKGAHALRKIGLHFAQQGLLLRIEADSPFPCKTFVLDNPHRLVVDLPGSWKNVKSPSVPQNRLVKSVRVGAQPAGPRIVLDLTSLPKGHSVRRDGNIVEISVQ